MLLMKKRLSIRDSYKTTLGVKSHANEQKCHHILQLFIDVIMDYNAHCEHEENEVERRREVDHQTTHDTVQGELNAKTAEVMNRNPMLKMLAKNIKSTL